MRALGLACLMSLAACSRGGGNAPAAKDEAAPRSATQVPVQLAAAKQLSFSRVVDAPGATQALSVSKIRAPFAGRLVAFRVADGDPVKRGQVIAELLAEESDAAVLGAESMLASAKSEQQRREAQRALEVAQQGAVKRAIRAPLAGTVLSHAASAGDRVASGDELLTVAAPSAIVFVAQVVQPELPRVRAGEAATVTLAAVGKPVPGRVHGILPSSSAEALASPVRIDLSSPVKGVGLFGTARIVSATLANQVAVPEGALLTDDVTGVTRVAKVSNDQTAHWVEVHPGLRQDGWVQLEGGGISPGDRVVTGGQVGLPDGATVVEAK